MRCIPRPIVSSLASYGEGVTILARAAGEPSGAAGAERPDQHRRDLASMIATSGTTFIASGAVLAGGVQVERERVPASGPRRVCPYPGCRDWCGAVVGTGAAVVKNVAAGRPVGNPARPLTKQKPLLSMPRSVLKKRRPCRHGYATSNPTCYGSRGQRGLTPRRRRHFYEEPWYATDVPFVEPALRTPPLARLQSPRVGEGAYGTLSAFGHALLQTSLDGHGLRRAKGQKTTQAPLHSPPGCPRTRFN